MHVIHSNMYIGDKFPWRCINPEASRVSWAHIMNKQNSKDKMENVMAYWIDYFCDSPGQTHPLVTPSSPLPVSISPIPPDTLENSWSKSFIVSLTKMSWPRSQEVRNAHSDYSLGDLSVLLCKGLVVELLAHILSHNMYTFHGWIEDNAQMGQGEELWNCVLAAISATHRNALSCVLHHWALYLWIVPIVLA